MTPHAKALIPTIDERYPNWYKWKYSEEHPRWVEVDKIVGTSSHRKSCYFDDWTPTPEGRDDRWWRVYHQMKNGRASYMLTGYLGPSHIHLVKIGSDYFVHADGNRRVSVAHMLGYKTIKADVVEYYPNTRNSLW